MVWFGVPREMLVLFDFGPRETYFPPKLAYASRGGTTALEAYQRLSRAEIPRETLKTMTWLYKDILGLSLGLSWDFLGTILGLSWDYLGTILSQYAD